MGLDRVVMFRWALAKLQESRSSTAVPGNASSDSEGERSSLYKFVRLSLGGAKGARPSGTIWV
eukprot:11157689-Lingulodinium_polyedra.AAC.1